MRLTLYEIETTARKASVGAGLPFGLSEDIAKAVIWLAGQNIDGVEATLNSIRAGMRTMETSVVDHEFMVFSNAQSAMCGPSMVDLLISEKAGFEVRLNKMDSAVLLLGFAGVSASQHKRIFEFEFSNGAKAVVFGNKVVLSGDLPSANCDAIVRCLKDEQEMSPILLPQRGVEINEDIWREIETLAAKTYVPESKGSRVDGAGAGLTDND